MDFLQRIHLHLRWPGSATAPCRINERDACVFRVGLPRTGAVPGRRAAGQADRTQRREGNKQEENQTNIGEGGGRASRTRRAAAALPGHGHTGKHANTAARDCDLALNPASLCVLRLAVGPVCTYNVKARLAGAQGKVDTGRR